MNAEQTLEYVRSLATHEVKLDSGRQYSFVLLELQRFMAFGAIPMPLLKQVAEAEGKRTEGVEPDTEDQRKAVQAMFEFYDAMLAEAIVAIDGEPVQMTIEAVKFLPEDDREELLEYLKREKDPTMADA